METFCKDPQLNLMTNHLDLRAARQERELSVSHDEDCRRRKSPLLVAVRTRRFDVVETLLRHGENVNSCDEKEQPLIFHAIQCLEEPVFRLFLKDIHEINTITSICGKRLLHHAVRHNTAAILSLLAAGCDVNLSDVVHGDSPLHVACFYGNIDAILQLLQGGADINILNKCGQTPLDKLLSLCQQPVK